MDAKSKTKLARMERYYPDVKIVVVDKTAYYKLSKTVVGLILFWETDKD